MITDPFIVTILLFFAKFLFWSGLFSLNFFSEGSTIIKDSYELLDKEKVTKSELVIESSDVTSIDMTNIKTADIGTANIDIAHIGVTDFLADVYVISTNDLIMFSVIFFFLLVMLFFFFCKNFLNQK